MVDEATFPSGLRAGDPSADGLVLSGRTTLPEVTLVGARWARERWVELPPMAGLAPVDGVVRIALAGLDADTEHSFALARPDLATRSALGRYCTFPAPGRSRPVVVGATSCLGQANHPWPTLLGAAAADLDLMLFVGDAIYTRAATLEDYRLRYERLHATPSFRELAAGTPLAAVWDDHEVANNWTLGLPWEGQVSVTAAQVAAAKAAFLEGLPQRSAPDGRLWRSLVLGDAVEIVLLDSRGERDGERIVSDAQLAWAIDALRSSRCAFKLLVSSVHVADHAERLSVLASRVDILDRWQGYPAQRDALVAALDEVPGAVVVTGDMHFGGAWRLGAEGEPGADVTEVGAGPAGSEPWPVGQWLDDNGTRTAQYLDLVETWSWARLVADPAAGTLTVEHVDDDGIVLATREVARLG